VAAVDDKIDWQEPASLPVENQIGYRAVVENITRLSKAATFICAIGLYAGEGR
jgi:hypothetical protein